MSGETSEMRVAGTERSVVRAQYGEPFNLQSRVNIYAYFRPENPLPDGTTFEDWILDHLDWTGDETVLDVGCGPGTFLSPIAERAGRVIGIDLSPGMLARAQEVAPDRRPSLAAADIEALPLVADSVDLVLAAFMLYHVPHLELALEELSRVLREDGFMVAVTNGSDDKAEIKQAWEEAGRRIIGPGFEVPRWLDNFNLDNGPVVLGERFDIVAVDRSKGMFQFPDPAPLLSWVQSLRPGFDGGINDVTWADMMGELERLVALEIEARGAFVARKDSGLVLARTRAT